MVPAHQRKLVEARDPTQLADLATDEEAERFLLARKGKKVDRETLCMRVACGLSPKIPREFCAQSPAIL